MALAQFVLNTTTWEGSDCTLWISLYIGDSRSGGSLAGQLLNTSLIALLIGFTSLPYFLINHRYFSSVDKAGNDTFSFPINTQGSGH